MDTRADYPRPSLAADVVVLHGPARSRRVLLVRRGSEPYEGTWALPGGFVDEYEPVPEAARRELAEETGVWLADAPVRVVGVYAQRGRDPRGWTASAVYLVDLGDSDPLPSVVGGDDADEARFWPVDALPALAFDHADILADALAGS